MSAKKSWDIQPKPRRAPQVAAATPSRPRASRPMEMRAKPRTQIEPPAAAVPISTKSVTLARGKKTRPEAKEPLKKRRKKAKKALGIALGIVAVLFVITLFSLSWLPALRVSTVTASGPHADEVKQLAQAELYGTHFFILPRNSLFFIPERDIRKEVLNAFPDVEALSISTKGLTTLSVQPVPRAEAFMWCGTAQNADTGCYSANAEGLIFAPVSPEVASSTSAFRIYGALTETEGATPIRARLINASQLPEALRFIKAVQTLGADVNELVFRGDEADLYTSAGTRITYVLGREEEAAGVAASVFPQLSLNDGSVQYLDLRFSGKAYFKRATPAE